MNAIVAGLSGLTVQHPADTTSSKSKKKRATDVANEFKLHFGSNVSNLGSWQELCRVVGITNIPSSITQCKKVRSTVPVS